MALATMTEREFPKQVLQDDSPVLVAFRASWCAPSQDLTPVVEETATEYKGRAKVVAVDVDGDPRANKICRRYDVSRLPVLMLFHEGGVKDLIGGATTKEVITDMLESRLRPVLDVGEHNFEAEVLRSRVPVLVHFHAAWCSASVELLPLVESMADRFHGRAKIARVEFGGENARLCARYGIVRVPTVVLFQGGQVKDRILGAMKGGTKVEGGRQTSCVGLTSFDNLAAMVEEVAL